MLITLLWSDIIKFFKLAIPKESKIKTGFFGWMSIILHQCVSCWSVLSVFEIREPYLICLLFTSWCMLITILIWFHRKNNNKFFKGVHFQNYWFFFYFEICDSFSVIHIILKPILLLCKNIKTNHFVSFIIILLLFTAHGYGKVSLSKACITSRGSCMHL